MDSINIGVFQMDISWENITSNQEKISSLLESLDKLPDILILPEMYSTGFTSDVSTLNILNKETLQSQKDWQQTIADKFKISIIGSVLFFDNQHFYNRLYFTGYKQESVFYNKRHLFKLEKQSNLFKPGNERVIIDFKGIKIMPQICYDLRFPVWSRNDSAYQLLIYVANWPEKRRLIWDTLLKARAIENQCYTIGVNRSGRDGNSIDYDGGSAVYGPDGEEYLLMERQEKYSEVNLSLSGLANFREKFGAYKDADEFQLKTRE